MSQYRSLFVPAVFLVLLFQSMVFSNCANIIPPLGGPKDSLPPLLVNMNPNDSTIRFNTNKITLVFNEYIELQNQRENIIVSPTPKVEPIIEAKLRTITIRIKDTLEPNTTYSINFGNSIKDITEANISKELTYLFSTGNTIDNHELIGNVILAKDGKIDTTLIAMLHKSGIDSALIKENPRYIAKLNGQGQFHFRNLPTGSFYLYALKDESGQKKYFSGKQAFAFNDTPIKIDTNNTPVTLYAFVEDDEKKTSNTNKTNRNFDEADEVNKTGGVQIKGNKGDKRLKFKTTLDGDLQDLLSNLEINFASPLKIFDSSKIRFTDESFNNITNYKIVPDSSNKKFTLEYKWKENTAYHIIIDKDFAEDSSGKKIARTDTLDFKSMKEADYGNLKLRFKNLDFSKKPVLLLIQAEEIKLSTPLASGVFNQKLFKPGEYDIRILWDSNGNGKWDNGQFFKKRIQPEKVENIEKILKVKANWDNDVTIELGTKETPDSEKENE